MTLPFPNGCVGSTGARLKLLGADWSIAATAIAQLASRERPPKTATVCPVSCMCLFALQWFAVAVRTSSTAFERRRRGLRGRVARRREAQGRRGGRRKRRNEEGPSESQLTVLFPNRDQLKDDRPVPTTSAGNYRLPRCRKKSFPPEFPRGSFCRPANNHLLSDIDPDSDDKNDDEGDNGSSGEKVGGVRSEFLLRLAAADT